MNELIGLPASEEHIMLSTLNFSVCGGLNRTHVLECLTIGSGTMGVWLCWSRCILVGENVSS